MDGGPDDLIVQGTEPVFSMKDTRLMLVTVTVLWERVLIDDRNGRLRSTCTSNWSVCRYVVLGIHVVVLYG